MSTRNYSNTATEATLQVGIVSSDTSWTLNSFSGFPAAPFTAAIERGTANEEIVLVTNVSSSTVVATRGYDGTTAKSHAAGSQFLHVTVALDYTEANAHNNATAGVHGVTGTLVGTTDTQTLTNKTLTSPSIAGPTVTGTATMANAQLSGTLSVTGATSLAGVSASGTATLSGNATVGGTLSVTGATSLTALTTSGTLTASGGITVPTGQSVTLTDAPVASTAAANKAYVDTKAAIAGDLGGTAAAPTVTSGAHHTHTSAQISDAASAPTASTVVVRDTNGRAQVADPAVAADIATKGYVDSTNIAFTYAGGWADVAGYQPLHVAKEGNRVHVSGLTTRTGATITNAVVTITTLGASVRPAHRAVGISLITANNTTMRVDVLTTGELQVVPAGQTINTNDTLAIDFTYETAS